MLRLLVLVLLRVAMGGAGRYVLLPGKALRAATSRPLKDYRFSGSEVAVKHFGNGVLLLPIDNPWDTLEAGLAAFEPGFELIREQPDQQLRAAIQPEPEQPDVIQP